MLILTVPLKEIVDERMAGGKAITPDFGTLNVRSWGKCAEDAPKGYMTVWADCDEKASGIKGAIACKGEVKLEKGDTTLLARCKDALK